MTDLRRYVQPEVSDLRVNRLWSNIAERLEARPQRSWRGLALALALGVGTVTLGGALFFSTHSASPPARVVLDGARLETAGDSLAVTLDDGSLLALASRTLVSVRGNQPSAVALELSRGELDCNVTHRAGRAFTVLAGDVEVRVIGTQFSVKSTPEGEDSRIEVKVLRGVVEIRSARRPGVVARVAAGQSWTQAPEPRAPVAATSSSTPSSLAVPARAGEPEVARSPTPATSAAPSGPTARELFEKAGERRRSGDAAAAARAYEELLRSYPGDGRTGLAAFELGRLRMDRLSDLAGAISALERAVASNVGPSFREDALARLVSAYAGQGNFAACGRARDRYLQSYPHGVHATAVASRCGKH